MKNNLKKFLTAILILGFFLSQSNAHAIYIFSAKSRSLKAQENLISALLPSFRYDRNNIELNQRTSIDLILEKSTTFVKLEVTGAEGLGLSIDNNTLRKQGIKIIRTNQNRNTKLNATSKEQKIRTQSNKPIIFNLKKTQNQSLIIEAVDFKVFKVFLKAFLPGIYTIKATTDSGENITTQVFTIPDFRIDLLSPNRIAQGVESFITLLGKGLNSLTGVAIEGSGIEVKETESLDDATLKVKVSTKDDAEAGFRNITISDPLSERLVTLVDGLEVYKASFGIDDLGIQIMDGMDGAPGMDGPSGKDGMGICNNPNATLKVFTINQVAGSNASSNFDSVTCSITFSIPSGFSGNNGTDGKGLCTNAGQIPSITTSTLAAGSMATVTLNPDACTLTYGIPQGDTGTAGMNGTNGTNGTNGLNSLVNVTTEAAGANCANGGKKIESGLDSDNSGMLDAGEVTATNYVCNGTNGTNGSNSLVKVTDESAGVNCANAGKKVESGVDTDNSGMLDPGEVTATNYVCNGTNGLACWDLNGNGSCDTATEDINLSGTCTVADCQGANDIPTVQEVISSWSMFSNEQTFTTASGDTTRMVRIPRFIHDGVIYGGFWVDKYEASKANATSTAEGTSTVPVAQRNVVPWTNISFTTAKSNASHADRQISSLGICKLVGSKEWTALYLLGRFSKEKSLFSATATNGWNERGNTRDGNRDGRNSATRVCSDDPNQSGTGDRCLTGTGYKSWGHILDGSATKNTDGTTFAASEIADDVDNTDSAFDGDKQVYDLVGNTEEWVDLTITNSSMSGGSDFVIDAGYQGAGRVLPHTTNNATINFVNIAGVNDPADKEFEGQGLPTSASGSLTDSNGGQNGGKLRTDVTDATYGAVRGGNYTSTSDATSPITIDFRNLTTAVGDTRGFRVICDFPAGQ